MQIVHSFFRTPHLDTIYRLQFDMPLLSLETLEIPET